ncbi:MAG TPA: hypothetical protein VGM56_07535 [Byssovorax sp.]|jgi:hypothetical protein
MSDTESVDAYAVGPPPPSRPGGVPLADLVWLVVGLVTIGALGVATLFVWIVHMKDIGFADLAKGTIALVAATAALTQALVAALRWRLPRWIYTGILLALGLAAFVAYFDGFKFGYSKFYHRWEHFHTYLPARYFPELGYERLYPCTAIAEAELGVVQIHDEAKDVDRPLDLALEVSAAGATIRRVENDTLVPTAGVLADAGANCKARFTPERWEAFKADVAFFRTQSDKRYWTDMQRDHGFAMTPVWLVAGRVLASLHPASVLNQQILALIDPLYLVAMFAALAWAFGARVSAAAMILWGCQAIAPFYWTGGAFLRQDWLFYLVFAACLAHKRWFKLAGASFAYAWLSRGFPGWAAIGLAVFVAALLVRRRRLPRALRHAGFGAVVAAITLFIASVVVAGPDAYPRYFEIAAVRGDTPLTNDVGLPVILSHDFGGGPGSGRMEYAKDPSAIDPFAVWKEKRRARFADRAPAFWGILACLAAGFAYALRRYRLLWIPYALSQLFIVACVKLTCMNYPFLVLTAPITRVRRGLEVALFCFASLTQILAIALTWNDDRYAWLSVATFVFLVGLTAAMHRPRQRARRAPAR